MVRRKRKREGAVIKFFQWFLLVAGLLIVFGTHVGLLMVGRLENVVGHATLNIIAGFFIVGYKILKRR